MAPELERVVAESHLPVKIAVVGGGPAGLYFALLMKRLSPAHQVRVIEQNPAGATYGWGVVFSDRALSFLQESDPDSHADVERSLQPWDDQVIVHRGQPVRIDGIGFSGIARLELLRILQEHCRRRGVELAFETRLADPTPLAADHDLVVGADGVNSVVRQAYAEHFLPTIQVLSNKYIWFGTHQPFDALTLTFLETEVGAFVAHHYRYSATDSTFIVECDAQTWADAGFASMPEDESRHACERVFRDTLGGQPLLTNRSTWINFRLAANRRWSCRNVVLLGDALRTVHFSIGSGTRMALEDAIALQHAFALHGEDVPAALRAFEAAHRPGVERFLEVARRSAAWYERFRDTLHLDPLSFAYDYVMRSGRISQERLRERSPAFAAAYEAQLAAQPGSTAPGIAQRGGADARGMHALAGRAGPGYRQQGYWRDQTLGELLDAWADAYGEREALVAGDQRISYRALQRRTTRLALHLVRLGLRPPDRIVLQLNNVPEFLYLYFACARIGVLPVMALPPHRFAEIRYLVECSQAAAYAAPALLKGFDYRELARAVRAAVPSLRHTLIAGPDAGEDAVSLAELLADPIETRQPVESLRAFRPDPADVALFLLSGGTTGLPKLIPRTHNDYEYNARASGAVSGIGPDTVYLVLLPISHNFPLASPGLQSVLQAGGRVVLADSGDPAEAFALIERERVTHTALVPALAIRWMEAPERERFDLSSLRVLQVGGARLNPAPAARVRPTLGCQLQQVFGMAEGLLNYTHLDDPEDEVVQTQGRPCSPDDEIRIVDEDDRDVPPGTPGNLLARGPYTIRGYYDAAEYNRRAFTADGYYRTGDVVRLSARGNLVVEGREKDMINRGGEKISAEEIENLILAHPGVSNAAVVAMPDPLLGERACAYVLLRPGASLDFAELIRFLQAKQIARFKLPERLELVERFPLTSVGKVAKQELRADVARKLAAERAAPPVVPPP